MEKRIEVEVSKTGKCGKCKTWVRKGEKITWIWANGTYRCSHK